MDDNEQNRTREEQSSALDDAALREVVAAGDGGVGQLMAVYENIEARYFSALMAQPTSGTVTYATHT